MVANLVAEDAAGRDVVAVAETAGQAKDLIVSEFLRRFEDAVHVQPLRRAASEREGVRRLFVAIGARGSEDEDSRRHGYHLKVDCQADFSERTSASITGFAFDCIITRLLSVTVPICENGTPAR